MKAIPKNNKPTTVKVTFLICESYLSPLVDARALSQASQLPAFKFFSAGFCHLMSIISLPSPSRWIFIYQPPPSTIFP